MSEAAQWDHDLPSVSKVVSLSSEWWSMNMSNQVLRWGPPVLYVLDVSVLQHTSLKWSGHYEAWYDVAHLEHDVLLVADVVSTSPRWCTIKIQPCVVWIRDMTSGFSDYFGPDSSADGSLCISQLSLSSSFYHLPLLPLRTAAMNAVIYSAAIAGQSLFQARRLTSVLQGCFDWLLCVKGCFIFRFNPCTTCDIKSAYICSSTQYSGCVIAEKK